MSFILLGILNAQAAGGGGAGAYDLLETQILASSASSVTFTGLDTLAAGYQHLQIRGTLRSTRSATFGDVHLQFNADTSTSYNSHRLYGGGSDVRSFFDGDRTNIKFEQLTGATSATGSFSGFVIDILDFSNTSKNTTTKALWGSTDNNQIGLLSGLYRSTSAITSMSFSFDGFSAVAGSRLSVYGIKGE